MRDQAPNPGTAAAQDLDRHRGCLLGLAAGDAVGTTVEFAARGTFAPVTDMNGGGPFNLQAGQWTDDTSMALCLATSLLECGAFDPADQMERYRRWQTQGYLSSTGQCFDIGNTVAAALTRWTLTGEPYSGSTRPDTAGNGALMRLAPVPMFYRRTPMAALEYCLASSRTTHACAECLDAAWLLGEILLRALAGAPRQDLLIVKDISLPYGSTGIARLAQGAYLDKAQTEIRGTGYVVHSLEAALWCLAQTSDYRSAILAATNLGDDADTTAAICGQIAGAHYGADAIPLQWRQRLSLGTDIQALADRLYREGPDRDA